MADHTFIRVAVSILLLTGLCLGGLDQSGRMAAKNLTLSDFTAQVPQDIVNIKVADLGAPENAAANAGTDIAVYTKQVPSSAQLGKLQSLSILSNPPRYMYYSGKYLSWSDFAATFPSNQPGLWIERAVSWSLYATLPLGGWTRELLYVPVASPLTMYELYPGGFVMGYDLGFVQPGYYYIWYYADTPGRHRSVFATSNGYSNTVIIDVYMIEPSPRPIAPSPQAKCEQKSYCHWVNGQCLCTMPPDPERDRCLEKPYCNWVDGRCLCIMPDPEKEKCEQNPLCDWVDGQCYCRGDTDPDKEKCEQNPECSWADGQCLCRGLNPPEPKPEPFNPAPNPVAQCESNPSCHWTGGQCVCMGLGTSSNSEGGDDPGSYTSSNLGATS